MCGVGERREEDMGIGWRGMHKEGRGGDQGQGTREAGWQGGGGGGGGGGATTRNIRDLEEV